MVEQQNIFNYVLLGNGEDLKAPYEKAWQKKIHRRNCPILKKHRDKGKNFGIQSNNSSIIIGGKSHFLIMIDFDNKEFMDKVVGLFPETLSTTSGSPKNCKHLWFASDNNKSFKIKSETMETLADILGAGNQIVAPGSKHQSGSTYSIVDNVPIVFISYAEIEAILRPYDKSPKKVEKSQKQYVPKGISDDNSSKIMDAVSMKDVLEEFGVDTSKSPTNCPMNHSSEGGKCFGWSENICHCWHCEGAWNKFSLVREAKNLTDKDTFEWFAEKAGMLDELKASRKEYAKSQEPQNNPKFAIGDNKYIDISEECFTCILKKREDEATELIATEIKKNSHIYSTRNDIKNEMWVYQDGIYVPNGGSYIKETTRQILGMLYTSQRVNKIIAKIEADTFIDEEVFFSNNILEEIPVLNGILNLKSLTLSDYTPDKIFFCKIPIKYDKTKTCPNIDSFFEDVLKSKDDKKVIYELFGYCLWKDGFLEQAIMCNGEGSNGKGKTLMLLKTFLGEKSYVGIPISELVSSNFDLSELFGKLANIAGDLSSLTLKDTGAIKSITGRDPITTKRKFKTGITFTNYSKQVFACNDLPVVYDTSYGFWRRWILLDFPYKFIDKNEYDDLSSDAKGNCKIKDVNIVNKLTTDDELSGLLNKSLEGLFNILKTGRFSYSKGTNEVKESWVRKSNSFVAFCMDCVDASDNNCISKNEVRKKFMKYCKKHKIKGISDISIKITLETEFGATSLFPNSFGNTTSDYAWSGIKWKVKEIEKSIIENEEEASIKRSGENAMIKKRKLIQNQKEQNLIGELI